MTGLYHLLKEKGFKLPSEIGEQIYIFNKYYTVTRYPDAANGLPSESVDRIEGERAVSLAREVLNFAERYVRDSY